VNQSFNRIPIKIYLDQDKACIIYKFPDYSGTLFVDQWSSSLNSGYSKSITSYIRTTGYSSMSKLCSMAIA